MKYCYLPVVKLWVELSFFFDTSSYMGIYSYSMYILCVYIYIYKKISLCMPISMSILLGLLPSAGRAAK